jgi:hypothetical protein
MTFEDLDRVFLATEYTLRGEPITEQDDARVVRIGDTATVVDTGKHRDLIVVTWDDHPIGRRVIDPGCLDYLVSKTEIDETIQSIKDAWRRG